MSRGCKAVLGILGCLLGVGGLQAQQAATTLTLAVSPATVVAGQAVTLTATLASASGSVSGADGSRVRIAGVGITCSGVLSKGVAACRATVKATQTPIHADATASFPGTTQLQASTSNTVNVAILAPGSNVASALQGPYIFQFDGYTDAAAPPGVAPRVAGLGRLVADGSGNLSGSITYNGSSATVENVPVTGTYSVSTDGLGKLTLTAAQYTQQFDLLVGLPVTTGAPDASLLETGDHVLWGSATLRAQTFVSLPSNNAAEGGILHAVLGGETACGDCHATGHASGEVRAAWSVKVNPLSGSLPPSLTLVGDQTIKNSTVQNISVAGQYTAPDATGRLGLTLDGSGLWSDEPLHLLGYVVDTSHIAFLSTDSHSQFILLSGDAVR